MSADRQRPRLPPSLTILVVGYNSLAHVPQCLSAIEQSQGSGEWEIRFVNNGTDSSEDYIRREHPDVKVYPTIGNVGFGTANNYLAKGAVTDCLVLLNPDAVVKPDAIGALMEAARGPYSVLGGREIGKHGDVGHIIPIVPPTLGYFARSAIGRSRSVILPREGDRVIETEAVSGSFFLVKRAIFEEVGGFDEKFFLYAEELDLCRRIRSTGERIGVVPDAVAIHDTGSGDPLSSARMLWMATGIAQYCFKHQSRPLAVLTIATFWLTSVMRWLSGSFLRFLGTRFADAAKAARPIALYPHRWMRGFASPGADPRRSD